jgi:hypothetical protein
LPPIGLTTPGDAPLDTDDGISRKKMKDDLSKTVRKIGLF